MAELNKGALTSENNNSFPNNNTGFITPTLLRTFNGNMIDSLVDEVTYNLDSASFSSSISQLKNFSSSLDNTYATDAQLSASASTLQNNINSLSASVAVTDLAQSSSIAALQVFSSSLDATFATDAQLSASASTLQNNINLKVNTSSTSSMTVLSSSYALSASYAGNVPETASYSISSSQAITASFLLGSIESASFATSASQAITASFALNVPAAATASFAISASFAFTSSVTQQVSTSISSQNLQHNVLFVDTTGPGFVQVDGGLRYNPNTNLLTTTASLALTASFAENVPSNFATTGSNTFTDTQTINLSASAQTNAITIIGNADRVTTDMYVEGGNFDTFNVQVSASNGIQLRDWNGVATTPFLSVGTNGGAVSIPREINITGSLKLSGGSLVASGNLIISGGGTIASIIGETNTLGTTRLTGSFFMSGSTFNAKVSESALSVGTTTLDTLFESTASGVTSQIDLTRLGAGPTGDLTAVRLQTLSGSDTSGDTLLSRITTGVNRHTSTAMTGSVVNSTITSTWATGSGGTRVAYSTTINANAQSQSATLTLSAGNLASNNAGGTASLQAGLVRIGATNGTTSFTGSVALNGAAPTIVSGSLSGSVVTTLGDTYASTPQGNFIVTIDSSSMAVLLSGGTTNPNTIYFVI
jgi:hypothetical protein